MTESIENNPSDTEAEILNAIAAFEKILEALPSDRISLETLADAYEKVGDRVRAQDYLLRLANVLIEENDEDAARDLLRKIRDGDQNDPQIQSIITRIENMEPEKVRAVVMDKAEPATLRASNISAEISFAWNLRQAQKLSQEEYSSVVQDLTEHSSKSVNVTITTLHVLNDRHFPGLNDIMAFASNACNTPIISLASFELMPECLALLSLEFSIRRGAIIFELMGNDALVAMLNPYDEQLAMDIEDLTGKPAYLYLVTPADFDAAIDKIKQALLPPASGTN